MKSKACERDVVMPAITAKGKEDERISKSDLRMLLEDTIERIDVNPRRILLIPPDMTRLISKAGEITAMLYAMLSSRAHVDIIPALGTHSAMSESELRHMFGEGIPLSAFKVHDWRNDVVRKGVVDGDRLAEWSEGRVKYDVGVEVNKILFEGYDLILSVGQVLPHEVVGMANYTKNIMVGVGGADTINKSHFLGAAYNMERILGRAQNPVRKLFNTGVSEFMGDLPICYMLTVVGKDAEAGDMALRGFFAGYDEAAFLKASALAQQVNINQLSAPLRKVVAYLDPSEFKSTWLGNKSVYRTRMALADEGELLVIAPGLKEFGEDKEIDRLVRKYGYRGTPATLEAVERNEELRNNLSAAAHMIHGSSEGRFSITYAPGHLTEAEMRSVNFNYADIRDVLKRYDPAKLKDGVNIMPDGEEIYYVSNPAAGLWALKEKLLS